MDRKILCMFSGGLDSTGVLHRLLMDSEFAEYTIHVHHMSLVNKEGRHKAELRAVCSVLSILEKTARPFLYTDSTHEYLFMHKDFIWDMDLCAFMAGNICNADPAIRYAAMGRTRTDIDNASHDFLKRMDRAQHIFRAVKMLHPGDSEYIFPVEHLSKREVWEMLPDDLRQASWSCRNPVSVPGGKFVSCGKCAACIDVRSFSIYGK